MLVFMVIFLAPAVMVMRSTIQELKDGMKMGWDRHSLFRLALWIMLDAITVAAYVASAIETFSK